MTTLAYAWIVFRKILTAGYGLAWIALIGGSLALATSHRGLDAGVKFFPVTALHFLVGLLTAAAVATLGPAAFLAFRHRHSVDIGLASRPIGRFARAVGAALGSATAAAALAAGFAGSLLLTGENIDGLLRRRLAVLDVKPNKMRATDDRVDFLNPGIGEIQFFPQVGFSLGYGDPEPVVVRYHGDGSPTPPSWNLTLRAGEAPRAGPLTERPEPWHLTRISGRPPIWWPEGSVVVVGPVMGTRRTCAVLFLQLIPFLVLIAGASAALATLLETPVASFGAGVVGFLALTSVLPGPLSTLNLTHYIDVGGLMKGLIAPVDATQAALAFAVLIATLAVAPRLRRAR